MGTGWVWDGFHLREGVEGPGMWDQLFQGVQWGECPQEPQLGLVLQPLVGTLGFCHISPPQHPRVTLQHWDTRHHCGATTQSIPGAPEVMEQSEDSAPARSRDSRDALDGGEDPGQQK